jgi:hypothetical protein
MVRLCTRINKFPGFFICRVWEFMIFSLFISLVLCSKEKLCIVSYKFLIVRIWVSWPDRPFIIVDIEDAFILLFSTNILSIAVCGFLWVLVAKLNVCDWFYVVNNEVSFLCCFQWDNLCLCLHKLKIPLKFYTDMSKHHLNSQ